MKKHFRIYIYISLMAAFIMIGVCLYVYSNYSNSPITPSPSSTLTPTEIQAIKPNESGKIMIVAFHGFSDFAASSNKDTSAINDPLSSRSFSSLISNLYNKNYRPISLSDYLDNNISIPAGCIPIIFTFDGGRSSQFNLVKQVDGTLVADKYSAVGAMESFAKAHSDFKLKGVFYISLGNGDVFSGEGTLTERFKYLQDKGFEIGNQTLTCPNLNTINDEVTLQREIALNQQKLSQVFPGYTMTSLALPPGTLPPSLQMYLYQGEFENIHYSNSSILEQGWDPAFSPCSIYFDHTAIHRIQAQNTISSNTDLTSWLKILTRSDQYVSDGNPNVVTVPADNRKFIDENKLNGKTLIVY